MPKLANLPELIQRLTRDLKPPGSLDLRRSDVEVYARAFGAAIYSLQGYLDWIYQQHFPDTCNEVMLLRYAQAYLKSGRHPAVAAHGFIEIKGSPQTEIASGTIWQSDDGRRYRTTETKRIIDQSIDVPVTAEELGLVGDLNEGEVLHAVSPTLGLDSQALVLAPGITGGSDEESIEALRQRVIQALQLRGQAGSAADYVMWARQVPGVTRAWVQANYLGPGSVGVWFARDNDTQPIPSSLDVKAVADHIETLRPITAEVIVMAPMAHIIDFKISLYLFSQAVQAAVETSLADLLQREGEPGRIIYRSHIDEAINLAVGEIDHVLLEPAHNIQIANNALAQLGTIQWQTAQQTTTSIC